MPLPSAGLAPSVSPCQFLSLVAVIFPVPRCPKKLGYKKDLGLDLGNFHFRIRKRGSSRTGSPSSQITQGSPGAGHHDRIYHPISCANITCPVTVETGRGGGWGEMRVTAGQKLENGGKVLLTLQGSQL